jgi:Heavy metal binding domain
MKRYPGMNIMRGALLAVALIAAACGGEKSVASKSAEAYREAQAKGIAVGGGHDHGGHGATSPAAATDHSAHATATGAAAATDHSAHGAGADAHAGMNHGAAPAGAADHSAHGAPGAVDHAAMGHGTATSGHAGHTPSARGGATDHAAMGHGTTMNAHAGHGTATRAGGSSHAAMGHGTTADPHAGHTATTPTAAHAQHGGTAPAAADPHAQHRAPAATAQTDHSQHGAMQMPAAAGTGAHAQHGASATAAPAIAAAPRSNVEMQRMQPAATLRRDAFDAPAAVSVAEAAKATQGGGHEGHGTRGITPGEDRENPPSPMPATRDGSTNTAPATDHRQHGAASSDATPAAATVYACPMHPEVTSDKPGTCPKCGMTLVKKNG